jgi:hypothetical protein
MIIKESSSCTAGIPRKGIVLMLHGWAQNAHVFAMRTKKLTKYVSLPAMVVLLFFVT